MSCGPASGWCGTVRPGEPYTRDQCQRCWLMLHSPNHRRNWKVEGPAVEVVTPPPRVAAAPPARLAAPPPCQHLGGPTGKTVGCASCSGLRLMPTYHCGLHGLTVLGDRRPKAASVAACRWCPDRPWPAG